MNNRALRVVLTLIPWLTVTVALLLLVILFKNGTISTKLLTDNKDFIEISLNIVEKVFIITAGVVAYFKFFRGRILAPKLNVQLQSGVIDNSVDSNLIWVEVQLENKGSVSIWNYKVSVYAMFHSSTPHSQEVTSFLPPPPERMLTAKLVEVGETAYEKAFLEVPKKVKAVTFQTHIEDDGNTTWHRSITVANKTDAAQATTKPDK